MNRLLRGSVLALLTVVTLWVVASMVWLPNLVVEAADNPVTSDPGDVGLSYGDVSIPSGDLNLTGWWIPAPEPCAVMLFAHGAGSNRTSWFLPSLKFYKAMTELGVSVLTLDLRNHGNSPRTDGKLGMGRTEWPDLLAGDAWLDAYGNPALPRVAMGLSMGGATAVYAIHQGLTVDALILMDPLLNTQDAIARGGWIAYGLPDWLFRLMAWATVSLGTLPKGAGDAGALAERLSVPTLLIQDATDPITRLPFAQSLADANPALTLAIAPTTASGAGCLANKGRWGTHVAAFKCHPGWTVGEIERFLSRVLSKRDSSSPKTSTERQNRL